MSPQIAHMGVSWGVSALPQRLCIIQLEAPWPQECVRPLLALTGGVISSDRTAAGIANIVVRNE